MTDEPHNPEGPEQAIDDLEAPEAAQRDVAGGDTQQDGTLWQRIKSQSTGNLSFSPGEGWNRRIRP